MKTSCAIGTNFALRRRGRGGAERTVFAVPVGGDVDAARALV